MLNNIGLPGLLLIAVVVLVLFGRGKISSLMGEVGKGITAFKKGVNDGTKELEEEVADEAKDEHCPCKGADVAIAPGTNGNKGGLNGDSVPKQRRHGTGNQLRGELKERGSVEVVGTSQARVKGVHIHSAVVDNAVNLQPRGANHDGVALDGNTRTKSKAGNGGRGQDARGD